MTDSAAVPLDQSPALSIEKTVTGVGSDTPPLQVDAAGDVISYSILVRNTGNQTLTGVSVSDPRIANLDCDPNTGGNQTTGFTLAPNGTLTCTGTYTVTQADIDDDGGGDGDIDNTATADSTQTEPVTDSATVPVGQSPALSIEKTVTEVDGATSPPFLVDEAGDVISYSIVVTNIGNQTLTGVSVSDPRIANLDCAPALAGPTGFTLAPTETLTCTGTYTVTQGDIDDDGGGDGVIDNTATADSDQTGPAIDSAEVPLAQSPALSIEKTVTGVDADTTPPFLVDAAGDVISYSILVTNTGNQTLTGVSVSDPRIANLDCDSGAAGNQTTGFTLAPTGTLTCTGTYAVTQAEIDNDGGGDGYIDNTATADSDQTGPVSDSAAVPLAQKPALAIEKTVTGVGSDPPPFQVDAAGDVISYSIVVTNVGNQTLTGVSVSDPRIANLDCNLALDGNQTTGFTLIPGAFLSCTGSYAVTQADIDDNGGGDGDIDNTATADSAQTEPVTASAAVPLAQSPALTIAKTVSSVDGDTTPPFLVDAAGDVISYSILVTNTGNQTLTGVSVSDPRIANLDCDPVLAGNQTTGFTLAPNGTLTCTGTYAVTQGDIDGGGDIDNTATADSDQTEPLTDSEAVPLDQNPALSIDEDGDGGWTATRALRSWLIGRGT